MLLLSQLLPLQNQHLHRFRVRRQLHRHAIPQALDRYEAERLAAAKGHLHLAHLIAIVSEYNTYVCKGNLLTVPKVGGILCVRVRKKSKF